MASHRTTLRAVARGTLAALAGCALRTTGRGYVVTVGANGRKKPNRTTGVIYARVDSHVVERAKAQTPAGMSMSEYVAALVLGQEALPKPGAELSLLALAGNRIVRALDAARLGGSDPALVAELRELRKQIAEALMVARQSYDMALDRQARDDTWSG